MTESKTAHAIDIRFPAVDAWLPVIRPMILPAAIAPVVVGSAIAFADGCFNLPPALASLAFSLLLLLGINLTTCYSVRVKGPGAAGIERKNAARNVLLDTSVLRAGIAFIFTLCGIVGLYLFSVGGLPVLLLGSFSFLAALAYNLGPCSLSSHGLGDVFIFVLFGLVGVCGTYYVQALDLTLMPIMAAVPVGFLVTAVFVADNLRNIPADVHAGKRTLAVILGESGSRTEYIFLAVLPFLFPFILLTVSTESPWALLPLIAFPKAAKVTKFVVSESGPFLNHGVAQTAHLALVYSLFLSAAIILAR